MYSFKELPLKDIVKGLNAAKINVTENAIKNPKPATIKNIFKSYYMFLTSLNAEQISRPDYQICDNVDDELISGFEFLNCYYKLKEILEAAGIKDFSLKDFYAPKEKRLTHVFSGLMNFAYFEIERLNEYTENNNKKEEQKARNLELQKLIEEAEIQIKEQQGKLQERAKLLEDLRSAQTSINSEISEFEMGQKNYQDEICKLTQKYESMLAENNEYQRNIESKKNYINQMNEVLSLNQEDLEDEIQKGSNELDQIQEVAVSYVKLLKESEKKLEFIDKNRVRLIDSVEKCLPITKDIKKLKDLDKNSKELEKKRCELEEMRRRVEELRQVKNNLEEEKQKQEAEFSEINQKIMSQNKTKKKLQKQKLNCGYEAEDNFKLMQEKIEDYLRSLSNAMETIEKANM